MPKKNFFTQKSFIDFIFFFFFGCPAACGIKPATPAVEAGYLNHWTARELPSP